VDWRYASLLNVPVFLAITILFFVVFIIWFQVLKCTLMVTLNVTCKLSLSFAAKHFVIVNIAFNIRIRSYSLRFQFISLRYFFLFRPATSVGWAAENARVTWQVKGYHDRIQRPTLTQTYAPRPLTPPF
jgi:hypothetical protein